MAPAGVGVEVPVSVDPLLPPPAVGVGVAEPVPLLIGVDIGEEFPKPLTDEFVRASDVVITMGCGDACPIYPGKRYLDWELEDPAGQPVEAVRPIVDEIDRRVRALLTDLVGADTRSR